MADEVEYEALPSNAGFGVCAIKKNLVILALTHSAFGLG
jgi:hypothetical protein